MNEHKQKEDYVIFSSRFDDEKDPMFFLDLVEACPHIEFKLVKPRAILTTNPEVISRLNGLLSRTDNNLELVDTSNKLDYYRLLAKAKVQFNCDDQDWVSWTLLEGVTFECLPLYPIRKDFPIELSNDRRYLYHKRDLGDCVNKLNKLMTTDKFDYSLDSVVTKHDNSWKNYLKAMEVI